MKVLPKHLTHTGICVIVLVYAALIGFDWHVRFAQYRWHEGFWVASTSSTSSRGNQASDGYREVHRPASAGGDLSSLLPLRAMRHEFEEQRPSSLVTIDSQGYINDPKPDGTFYPFIVTGDSNLLAGSPQDNMFASRLEHNLGQPVLNRGLASYGPVLPLLRVLHSYRGRGDYPDWIIWIFIERTVTEAVFSRYRFHGNELQAAPESSESRSSLNRKDEGFLWYKLLPNQLADSLPETSGLARRGEIIYYAILYRLFDMLPPDLIAIPIEKSNQRLLGFVPALEILSQDADSRGIRHVASLINDISGYLDSYGIKLLVVPIPEKENIYRDSISRRYDGKYALPDSDALSILHHYLNNYGIHNINLHEVFAREHLVGNRLYWRDDTHWNDTGIRIAAEEVSKYIRNQVP